MNLGWIKLHRSILQWEWWDEPNTVHLFLYCLIKANTSDKRWHGEIVERGSFITSRTKLAKETGLTEREVRTSLERLKSTNELTSKTTSNATKITITNFDRYQVDGEENDPISDQRATSKRPAKRPAKRPSQQSKNKRFAANCRRRATSKTTSNRKQKNRKNDHN